MNAPGSTPSEGLPLALSARGKRTPEAPITALMAASIGNPDLISFAAGFVDPVHLPAEECASIARRILGDPQRARRALQYGTTQGLLPLRERLLKHLEELEGRPASSMGLSSQDVLVTTGSQQLLFLVADVLVDPGDIVIAANPAYFVYTGTLLSLGAQVLTVPMDEEGMNVDAVDALLGRLERDGRLPRVKFIYCTSFYDNPTGLTLSRGRRKQLVDVVRKYGRKQRILILEDAAYRELRYEGEALPSIKSFDEQNEYTILTQTFSKPFSPGLKLGYTFLPHGLMEPVMRQKGNHDFGSANLCQEIALEAMRDGSYSAHVEVLRREYRKKRDVMLDALDRHLCGGDVRWTRPAGGLYVWLTFPEAVDTSREGKLFRECVNAGVLYVPGDLAFGPDERGRVPKNHLRLNFVQVGMEQIEPGIARLASVAKEQMRDRGRHGGNPAGAAS